MVKMDSKFDFTKDWNELNNIEKLSWTVFCNEEKEQEVRKFAKKAGIPFEAYKDQLEFVNPIQRWYEHRLKEVRKLKRNNSKI
jgi:hypothetical protein